MYKKILRWMHSKKTSKVFIIILFILFAIPIPISLDSCISFGWTSFGLIDWSDYESVIEVMVVLPFMILSGTYLISYIIALVYTIKKRTLSRLLFLPIIHIVLFFIWGYYTVTLLHFYHLHTLLH